MAKYVTVSNENGKVSMSAPCAELSEAIVIANRVFSADEDVDVTSVTGGTEYAKAVRTEQLHLMLELHGNGRHAFVFRVPNFLSFQARFSLDKEMKLLGSKKIKKLSEKAGIVQDGQLVTVTF